VSNILISGCGITFPGERPTWVNVLRICGMKVKDLSGPAISNTLILNSLIKELHENQYSHVICQLTASKKLDVELNEHNESLMHNDPVRNFSHNGYWPSSISEDNTLKKDYYKYLYSPTIEQEDTIIKLLHLQNLCDEQKAKLFIIQGYKIDWQSNLIDKVRMDKDFVIETDYEQHETFDRQEHIKQKTVPNKHYQIKLARYINDKFLKLDGLHEKLERFNG